MMMQNFGEKAVVIGGCGYIGSRLTLALIEAGIETIVLDPGPIPDDLRGRCPIVRGDIVSGEGLPGAFAGCSTVFLIAGALARLSSANPKWGFDLNVIGVTNVVRELLATSPIPRVVLASTNAIDDMGNWAREWDSDRPSFYAISRLAGEAVIASACACSDLRAVALRMFTVYGPGPSSGQRGHFIASLLERAAAGQPLQIHGDGSIVTDITHMSDVVSAYLLTMHAPVAPGSFSAFYIGSGYQTKLKDIAQWIQDVEPSVKIEYQLDAKPALRRSIGDIGPARRTLGYKPQVAPEDGIKEVVRAFFNR